MAVTDERCTEALDGHEGWCTVCQDFTRDDTEVDAEGYDCPECGEQTVVGVGQALALGLLPVEQQLSAEERAKCTHPGRRPYAIAGGTKGSWCWDCMVEGMGQVMPFLKGDGDGQA